MDKLEALERLLRGAEALGLAVPEAVASDLIWLADELLRWNQRVNLTAITDPVEVVEKHLLDSLALLPDVGSASTVLDVGAGPGLPGLVLRIANPALTVTTVESVGKKVNFTKHVIATKKLTGMKALQARAEGHPDQEGLPRTEVAVARALMDLEAWVTLGKKYLQPGGKVLAMLATAPEAARLERLMEVAGAKEMTARSYALPISKAPRCVVTATF